MVIIISMYQVFNATFNNISITSLVYIINGESKYIDTCLNRNSLGADFVSQIGKLAVIEQNHWNSNPLVDSPFHLYALSGSSREEFENTKGVIIICISKKNRQHNGQNKKVQKDKQRSTKHTYKTKDRVTRILLKTGGGGGVNTASWSNHQIYIISLTRPVVEPTIFLIPDHINTMRC
jgi:hypothetical protein